MQSNEAAAQALILDISNYETVSVSTRGRKSPYDLLFGFIPSMVIGQIYKLTEDHNWIADRTFVQNKQNLLHHVAKNDKLKGYSLQIMELQPKALADGTVPDKIAAFKLLKKPAETAPIPENLNNGEPIVTPTATT